MNEQEYELNLIDMHSYIDKPEFNNAGVVSQFIVEAMKLNKNLTLSLTETILRKIKSRVRLMGFPLQVFKGDYVSKLPFDDTEQPYALWIGVNGLEGIKEDMRAFDLKPADTDLSLEKTGFLHQMNS